jgi:hypothetical protein
MVHRDRVVLFLAAGALVLAAASMTFSAVLFAHLQNEGAVRRNATCTSFERAWQVDVRNLTSTYEYLDNLTPKQLGEPLNVAILHQLPRTEQQVKADKPPSYCKGDVGLDDSKFLPVPKRPRRLATIP